MHLSECLCPVRVELHEYVPSQVNVTEKAVQTEQRPDQWPPCHPRIRPPEKEEPPRMVEWRITSAQAQQSDVLLTPRKGNSARPMRYRFAFRCRCFFLCLFPFDSNKNPDEAPHELRAAQKKDCVLRDDGLLRRNIYGPPEA